MAFLKTFETNSGIELENAYHRISNFNGDENITFSVLSYKDQQARQDGKEFVAISYFTFTPSYDDDAQNIKKQAYEYLKNTDVYAGAIDILE